MGTISTMNVTIKNNRKLLKDGKRKPFTKRNSSSKRTPSYKPYVLPQAQPHVLRRIRRRLEKENKRLFYEKLVVGIILAISLIVVFFAKFN